MSRFSSLNNTNAQSAEFFAQLPLTRALFTWLEFRLFVAEHRVLEFPSDDSQHWQAKQWLHYWQGKYPVQSVAVLARGLYLIVSALSGVLTMQGLLTFANDRPINLWLPLLIFALLPLLFSSYSLIRLLWSVRRQATGMTSLNWLVHRFKLDRYQSFHRLLIPWLSWQIQLGGIVFLLSALLTFVANATFQDIQFYWSSTFVRDVPAMKGVFDTIALPWHWWLSAPSLDAVQASHLAKDVVATSASSGLWSFILMSIVVYGLFPRVVVSIITQWRLRRRLIHSVLLASDIEQFLVMQQHRESENPLTSSAEFGGVSTVTISSEHYDLIAWQQTSSRYPVVQVLGLTDWPTDERWLRSSASHRSKPILVLADFWSTPTGELADSIALIEDNNSKISLVLTQLQESDERYPSQLSSWQFFAQRYHLNLRLDAEHADT